MQFCKIPMRSQFLHKQVCTDVLEWWSTRGDCTPVFRSPYCAFIYGYSHRNGMSTPCESNFCTQFTIMAYVLTISCSILFRCWSLIQWPAKRFSIIIINFSLLTEKEPFNESQYLTSSRQSACPPEGVFKRSKQSKKRVILNDFSVFLDSNVGK